MSFCCCRFLLPLLSLSFICSLSLPSPLHHAPLSHFPLYHSTTLSHFLPAPPFISLSRTFIYTAPHPRSKLQYRATKPNASGPKRLPMRVERRATQAVSSGSTSTEAFQPTILATTTACLPAGPMAYATGIVAAGICPQAASTLQTSEATPSRPTTTRHTKTCTS